MTSPGEEIALLGIVKDTSVVLGKKFVLKTLDSDEEASAQSAAAIFDAETKRRILKIERLARAIETIDGVPFSLSEDEKSRGMNALGKARSVLYRWQPPVVDRVYAEYEKLEKRRDEAIAEIEKNAMSPVTSSGAGR